MPHSESLDRTSRVVLTGLWLDAVLVMAASAWNGGRAVAALGDPLWWGILLGVAVDTGLAMALIGDRALHRHGQVEPWGRAVKVTTALMSLALNCAVAVSAGQIGLAVFHAFLPILLILLSEYQQSATLQFHRIAVERDTADKAQVEQAAAQQRAHLEAVQQRDEQLRRAQDELVDARRQAQELRQQLDRQQTVDRPAVTSQPAPVVRPARTTSADRETRRQWVRTERAVGRTPTGADVDRRFGSPRNGAAVVKEVLAEEKKRLHVVGGKR